MKAFGSDTLVNAVLDDHEAASIEPRLKTTLTFLEKLTLDPWSVTPDDITPMHEAGLPDEAIEEAIRVCTAFNIIDRIADALDFEISNAHQLRVVQRILLGPWGYLAAVIPGGRG